ncbi:MAG: sigma-54-dependent Fis family transcriptional regulator [Desulfovibrionaceae bacterium]|nr:sigma-54-dependent Fis family transcriptional regulator [Desulfovibrionaceae bacterium]
MGAKILVVDDEQDIRFSLSGILEDEGHEVVEAATGEEGLKAVEAGPPDLVFLDIWLPGMDGLAVLDRLREDAVAAPVVMISGHGNIETAVSAIKKGAFDFIEKPLSLEKVVITTAKALEFASLRRENQALKARIATDQVRALTGESARIAELREQIARVAPTDAWVLITGENGTGKEIVARSVHAQSRRAAQPLVAVNCAAIPEELIESELFGHQKGAFTGADAAKAGKFEMADKGTLLLDEIGDMSLKTQAKILRILQEQSFERVGGHKTIRVDVRVIAATNKDLVEQIRRGEFREDLYYRLKVFPLVVPPLRERAEDVPLLIREFVDSLAREHGLGSIGFTERAMAALKAQPWPGNVRELKNFTERMMIMYMGREIDLPQLPPDLGLEAAARSCAACTAGGGAVDAETVARQGPVDFKAARAEFERAFLEAKLREYGGNVAQLAEAIGMERSYLYRKLKGFDILTDA